MPDIVAAELTSREQLRKNSKLLIIEDNRF